MQSAWAKGLLLAILFNGVSGEALGSSRPLSLKEALQYALAHSPAFDTARKTEALSGLRYKSALAKLLPSVDFSTTDGLQNNIAIASTTGGNSVYAPNSTAPWSSALSLGVKESLYDNGVTLTGLSIAHLGRELAAIDTLRNRDNLALGVVTEFYHLSLATALLEVRKSQQTILDKQFKLLTHQYEQGFKPKSDYLRIKTQVQRAEIDRISAENDIVQSEASLRKQLGVGYRDPEPPKFEALAVEKGAALEFPVRPPVFESLYDFRISQVQQQINDENVKLVKRTYYPQLSLNSAVTYSNQSYLNSQTTFDSGQQLSWDVLVTLQYNLWDWGTRRRDVQAAEFNRDIQQNSLNLGLLDDGSKISGLMADLGRISRNYKLSQDLLSLEEESNRNLEAQYREGKVTYLDLITSLNSLLDAKIQFYTSYFSALTSVAQYRYYEGKIYEDLVEK